MERLSDLYKHLGAQARTGEKEKDKEKAGAGAGAGEGEKKKEPMDIPRPTANFSLLHQRIRNELDPDTRFMSDDELVLILRTAGFIPYRAITRCLIHMEEVARKKYKSSTDVMHVRDLKTRFSAGLLKLNAERFSSRC